MRNTSLQALIDGVMASNTPATYIASITFISSSSTSYTFSPLTIDTITIEQRFDTDYMDGIQVKFPIASADYANMYDNMQNLNAILTLTFVGRDGKTVTSPAPIRRLYQAVIVAPRDVRRQFPDVEYRTTPDTSIIIRLIETAIYNIRQTKLNGIYQSSSMSGIVYHTIQSFGITKAYVRPLDNKHTYDHVLIPPVKDFSEIYSWLQGKYGLYACGATHYYTGGTLYLYAPFDTNPTDFPYTALFYQADEGAYSGATSFYSVSGNNINIVLNNAPQSVDTSQSGAENIGTSAMFLRASQLIDGALTVSSSGPSYVDSSALAVRLTQSKIATSTNVNNSYKTATDNPFALMAEMAEHQSNLVSVNWPNAVPLSLLPGTAVIYYSNENGTVMKITGILESAVYALSQRERTSAGITMACIGKIVLRLNPIATTS